MVKVPVSIRTKNPGAMWPGKSSKKFGSKGHENLKDGNKAAIFPTFIQGAAALYDLLDRAYTGMTVEAAIAKWSGGNSVVGYVNHMSEKTGLAPDHVLSKEDVRNTDLMVKWGMAQVRWETGAAYPMTKEEWSDAHALFLSGGVGNLPKSPTKGGSRKPLDWALEHIGEREVPGPGTNDFVMQCFADVDRQDIEGDETSWCAAFVGAALKRNGCAYLSGSLLARDYLDYGEPLMEPEEGCLVIFWRESPRSWKGHVAFVEKWDEKAVTYVGGNQSDAVTSMTAPRTGSKSRVLGYRRVIPAKATVREVVGSDSVKYKAVGILSTIAAIFSSTLSWFGEVVVGLISTVGSMLGVLPETAREINSLVNSGAQITQHSGLPWPIYASLAIVLVVLGGNLHSTWKRKRNRQDPETAPAATQEAK